MTPEHYNFKTRPIDAIKEWNLNFNLGNVLKYIIRHNQKNGIEDLRKALTYLEHEITNYEVNNAK